MQKLLERFTKEQLIERLKHRISVAEKYPDLEEAQYDEAIFRIALAAMDGKYPVITEGWKLLPMKLTAENGAKSALTGEFTESVTVACQECFGDEDCDNCNGDGRILIEVPVSWTTIKKIWQTGVEHFSRPQE